MANTNSSPSSIPSIRTATRLVRQWGNQVHLVNVEASGYEYQGVRAAKAASIFGSPRMWRTENCADVYAGSMFQACILGSSWGYPNQSRSESPDETRISRSSLVPPAKKFELKQGSRDQITFKGR